MHDVFRVQVFHCIKNLRNHLTCIFFSVASFFYDPIEQFPAGYAVKKNEKSFT